MEKKTLIMWLSRLKNSMKAHPDYFTGMNQEFVDFVEGAEEVLEEAEKELSQPPADAESDYAPAHKYATKIAATLAGGHYQSALLGYVQGRNDALQVTPTGLVWVKASDRMPASTRPPELIIVKWTTIGGNHMLRYMTANQLADEVKGAVVEYEWLEE